ncbi:hypothetical protein BH09ACT5_BH09ACT5_18760 [soil metagenome]
MLAPAIDDYVTTKLYQWYSAVSAWEPPGEGFSGICAECTEAARGCSMDMGAWPHDVIHPLVTSLRAVVDEVQFSYSEEGVWDAESAPAIARQAVAEAIARHAADIQDVLEQCVAERFQEYLTAQMELGRWDVRPLAP